MKKIEDNNTLVFIVDARCATFYFISSLILQIVWLCKVTMPSMFWLRP